jgi:hypothetical protein
MKRIVSVLTLILALLTSMVAGVQTVKADIIGNNGMHYASGPYIVFPFNVTYSSKFLTLNVSFSARIGGNINYSMSYTLDGIHNDTVPLVIHYFGLGFLYNRDYITGFVILPELSEGSHNLTVYLECNTHTWDMNSPNPDYYTYSDNQTVYFTINTTSEQEIPEFPSWAILPLFLTVTLLVTLYKKRLIKPQFHNHIRLLIEVHC